MRAVPLRLPESLSGPVRRAVAWRGWVRLRIPLACACFVGGVIGLTLPAWSGWWTHYVQVRQTRVFQHELTSVAPAASSVGTPGSSATSSAMPSTPSSATSTGPAASSTSASAAVDVPVGDPLAELSIPAIGVDAMVLEGLTYDPSVWTPLLRQGPAHVAGSALPGQPGNVVIFGHLNIWGAVFMHLGDVKPGDDVTLRTTWGTFTYRVTGSTLISQYDTAAVAATHTGPATLQLVTCEGVLDQHRRVVEATLVPSAGQKA